MCDHPGMDSQRFGAIVRRRCPACGYTELAPWAESPERLEAIVYKHRRVHRQRVGEHQKMTIGKGRKRK